MSFRRVKINRRTILRGMGLTGIGIALPSLDAMIDDHGVFHAVGRLKAQTPPKRMVVMHWPTGIYIDKFGGGFFYPSASANIQNALPEAFSGVSAYNVPSFDDLKSDINIVGGLTSSGVAVSVDAVHFNAQNTFTGLPVEGQLNANGQVLYPDGVGGPSFDQVVAQQIGGQTRFRSLVARLYKDLGKDNKLAVNGVWSWQDKRIASQGYSDPRELFNAMFTMSMGPGVDEAAKRKQSMLDFVKGDIDRLNKIVGVRDRATLDQHLTSIRELERQMSFMPVDPMSCGGSTNNYPSNIMDDAQSDVRSQALIQLLVTALSCDMTRVVFYSLGGDAQHEHNCSFIGLNYDNHTISHELGTSDATGIGACKRLAQWKLAQFGRMVRMLKSTNDGTAPILNNTAAVCTSDMSNGNGHWFMNLPVVVAGKVGNMQTGRAMWYACNGNATEEGYKTLQNACTRVPDYANQPISNLWLTMIRAMGATANSFGESTSTLSSLWL